MFCFAFSAILVSLLTACATRFVSKEAELEFRGMQLPLLGIGTAGLRGNTRNVVIEALNYGVKLIDSAQASEWYNETGVGEAFAILDKENVYVDGDVIVVTKIHPRSYGFDDMDRKLRESKMLLHQGSRGGRPLDVVLLHTPNCWEGQCTAAQRKVSWKTAWTNLEQLRSKPQHKIGAIGVSNFHLEILQELVLRHAHSKVAVVQNWMDPFHQDTEVREFCRDHDIQYMAYSSFGTQWNRNPNPVLQSAVLQQIATSHKCSVAQVVLSWVIQEGAIAIPRSSSVYHNHDNFGHLREHLRVASEGKGELDDIWIAAPVQLTTLEMERIRALDGSIGTPWD
jgi:diketogulonate reductase-like aldo/keto reductase